MVKWLELLMAVTVWLAIYILIWLATQERAKKEEATRRVKHVRQTEREPSVAAADTSEPEVGSRVLVEHSSAGR